MSVTKDSSTHSVQAETREGLSSAEKKAGFYLGENGEWIPDGWSLKTVGMVAHCNQTSLQKTNPLTNLLYLDTGSITKNQIDGFQEFKRGDEPSRARRLVRDESIVYSTVRPNQEHYGILKNPPENLVVSTGFCVIDATGDSISPPYLYYLLSQKPVTTELNQIAEQNTSAYPALSQDNIENLKFLSPPLPEQKAIAAVLSSLDDKIELLREQNETLETLAQTLFKRWFIDFNFPACMASPCAGKPVSKDYAEEAGSQADHPRVRMECRHPELSVYGYKDFGGMPQPQEGSSAPDGQAGKSFIYVLRLENGNRYVGMTDFLLRRYHEHKIGKGAKATKASPPVAMIHFEQFDSREEAAEREKWLKTGFGRKWLDREEEKGNLGAHVVQAAMIPSELGDIPEGWRVGKLSEAVDVKYGKDHKKLSDGKFPCYGSGGIMRHVEKTLCTNPESVLIPRKGTLSNLMYVREPFWSVDTMFFTTFKKQNFVKYFFLKMKRIDLAEMNVGSAVPSMTTAVLNDMNMLYPDEQTLETFESLVESFFIKTEKNTQQIQTLTKLRDTLLPKLMKGEIRISL